MDYTNKKIKFKINAAVQKETPQVTPHTVTSNSLWKLIVLFIKGDWNDSNVRWWRSQTLSASYDCTNNEIAKKLEPQLAYPRGDYKINNLSSNNLKLKHNSIRL